MKQLSIFPVLVLLLAGFSLKADEGYRYTVDLKNASGDKVTVTLVPPAIQKDEIDFMFPAMVPGTYEVYDFGRYISDFTAEGLNGEKIKVVRKDVNTYRISPAKSIAKISYKVDDTFDKSDLKAAQKKIVFEPGGTNFEQGKNYSINNHSMFGYFDGLTDRTFTIVFEKPEGFYPATGLSDIKVHSGRDTVQAESYHRLVDSPIMYSVPDTVGLQVAQTRVLVATYSPNKKITSAFIASTLHELLLAQQDYLGGQLPVEKYAFLFYFMDKPSLSGASGALEHSYSSFYVLPEFDSLALKQQIRDIAAHEFFHIVTPLTIHSKEIADFDFNNPGMSAHLWLYEGMTEYAAHHSQVKAGLTDVNEFLNVMMQKYRNSIEQYNDTMPFTYMSKNVLNEEVHKQYANVYEKGAVIGMCLDILLRDLSGGGYGTQNLMRDLSRKYGKDKAFNDDELFAEIENLTYPQVGEFLRRYVGGSEPLPMEDILQRIGIDFKRNVTTREFTLGNPDLGYNTTTNRLIVEGTSGLDAFGKALGYKRKDELHSLNGRELKVEEIRNIVSDYYETLKEGDVVEIVVFRPKKLNKKKFNRVTLSAPAQLVEVKRGSLISMAETISDRQKQTLRAWIGLQPAE